MCGWDGKTATAALRWFLSVGGRSALVVAELDADALGFVALDVGRRYPNDLPRDRYLSRLAHQAEEHKNLISNAVSP